MLAPRPVYAPASARPASPVALQAAKIHLNAGGCYDAASADAYTAEDASIAAYLAAATQWVEDQTGRGLLTQSWTATFAGLDARGQLTVEGGPIQAVAPTLEALVSGAWRAVAPAAVLWRPGGSCGRFFNRLTLAAAAGQSWPTADVDEAAWRVTFTAGWGAAPDVPQPLINAIKIMTKGLYENREDLNPGAAGENPALARLLAPYAAPTV